MVKRVVFVHGWDGQPYESWIPWLQTHIEKKGWLFYAPSFPGGEHPKLGEWTEVLKATLPLPDKHTYFVGHSLGCPAILRYLATLPGNTQVGGIVLVGGFCSDIGISPLMPFLTEPFDFEKIQMIVKKCIVIGSRDDAIVPFGKVLELQAELGAELMIDDGKGHFDDVTELPSVLKALEKCYQQRF